MRSPFELWRIAEKEHPDDVVKRRERYLELMRAEGHIVKKASDDNEESE